MDGFIAREKDFPISIDNATLKEDFSIEHIWEQVDGLFTSGRVSSPNRTELDILFASMLLNGDIFRDVEATE